MNQREIQAIVQDVETRLRAREHGVKFRTDRDHVHFSDAKILYIPVFIDSPPAGDHERIMDIFDVVERESETKFNVDVLVLPAVRFG